jgi:hypothetical protein
VFSFLGTNFFDVSVGESALEPIQLAVRSVIERAVLEMITRVYRAPGGSCAIPLGTAEDPLREAGEAPYAPPPVPYRQPYGPPQPYGPQPYGPQPYAPRPGAYTPSAYNSGGRNSPYGSYGATDPVGDAQLRGGL